VIWFRGTAQYVTESHIRSSWMERPEELAELAGLLDCTVAKLIF
jgi:hypothetical protein